MFLNCEYIYIYIYIYIYKINKLFLNFFLYRGGVLPSTETKAMPPLGPYRA